MIRISNYKFKIFTGECLFSSIYISIILLLSIPLILPYFHSGYFPTHDGLWAVVRLGEMFRELRDHQFPARWSGVLNFGYGYPLFNFAYPFPYYLGILIHLFHIPFITTTKLLFALSVPISGVGMFFLSRKVWRATLAGFLSSILYMYLPYRMVDLYVRGSIGESIALAIVPLLLFVLLLVVEKRQTIFVSFGGILLAALVMSHNIMGLFFTPLLFLFATIYAREKEKNILGLLWTFLLGLSLSLFFWLPAIFEKQWIYLSKIPIADRSINFVSISQLFLSPWQYGVPGGKDSFTFQLGWGQLIGILGVIGTVTYKAVKKQNIDWIVWTLLGSFAVMFALLFSFTSLVWIHIPLLKEINYPWTLLAPIGFVIALLSGFLAKVKKRFMQGIIFFIVTITIVQVLPFAKPQSYIYQPDSYFLTNDANTTSSSEYTPLWVKQFPLQKAQKKVVISGKGTVTSELFVSNTFSFAANLQSVSKITINSIYYPGWKIFVDRKPVVISYTNQKGVMQVQVPSGNHIIMGKFTETPLRLFADVVSMLSFLVYVVFLVREFLYKTHGAGSKRIK